MNNLKNKQLAIRITESTDLDNDNNLEHQFLNELKSAVDILTKAGFDDVTPASSLFEAREDKEITSYIEISPYHLLVNTLYYDEDGDLEGEEEGGYDINDFEEQLKTFNEVKAIFDPTPQPLLAGVWDQVASIRIGLDELVFEIDLLNLEEEDVSPISLC